MCDFSLSQRRFTIIYMKIINHGHACFQIVGDNVNVVFDPYQDDSVPNLNLGILKTNHLFVSHNHHDHNAYEKVNIVPGKKVECIVIECYHDKNKGLDRGLNKIHVVNIDGFKIAHFGDVGHIDLDYEKLQDIDIALIPINGYYTVGAIEALDISRKIKAKVFIPMHYFNKKYQTGYEDGNQIDILVNSSEDIHYIDDAEFEFTKDDRGIYIFERAKQ